MGDRTTSSHDMSDIDLRLGAGPNRRGEKMIAAYVLAKNERPNIDKCLGALHTCGFSIVVLDSGSTDGTDEAAATSGLTEVRPYCYVNHLATYRDLTASDSTGAEWVLILDADMEMSTSLASEIRAAGDRDDYDVVVAPIAMYVDGVPLRRGSLCPPKPIAFRVGREYFVAAGHGEKLAPGVRTYTTHAELVHNDLKPYEAYVTTQVRYGRQLQQRVCNRACRRRDRLRAATPLMGLAAAAYSLVFRGGLLAGRAGLAYALDRIIAGLIQYRVCLADRHTRRQGSDAPEPDADRHEGQRDARHAEAS